jgi:hypothetical protein
MQLHATQHNTTNNTFRPLERNQHTLSPITMASKAASNDKTTPPTSNVSDDSSKENEKPILTSAPPPMHAVAVIGFMMAFFIRLLPTWAEIDEIAVTDTFTRRVFPELISIRTLAVIRTVTALIIWATSIHSVFISPGWSQATTYLPHSKLKMVQNPVQGMKTMFPFTSVSWNLLGLAFTLSAYIAWSAVIDQVQAPSRQVLRTAVLVWEVAAPNTLLVAAVIRYVIWPGVLKAKADTMNLKITRNILMHNINVLFCLTETSLTGGLPVRWQEVSLAPLLGCAYVLFTWFMTDKWNTPEQGPQFIYFFFDTTLGATTSYALVALLVVLLVFYAMFVSVEHILAFMDGSWPLHVLFVAVVCSSVMRFRD